MIAEGGDHTATEKKQTNTKSNSARNKSGQSVGRSKTDTGKTKSGQSKTDNKPAKLPRSGPDTWKRKLPQQNPDETPQDIQNALGHVIQWFKMDKVQSDEDVKDRTAYYLTTCYERGQRPTVESYALSLGVTRRMLDYWKNGKYCSPERTELVNQVYEALAAFDAELVVTNKLQPVPYIFRAQNYYGLRNYNRTEITMGPINTDADKSPAELEEYLNIIDAD